MAVEQLQQMSLDNRLVTDNCKKDVDVYLDALKLHLWEKIESFGKEGHSNLFLEVDSLISSFGLDVRALQPAIHMSDDHLGFLLKDVKKVAMLGDHTSASVQLSGTHLQSYPYQLFEPIFLSGTPQSTIPCWLDFEKLHSRFIKTKLISSESIPNAWDVESNEGRLIILDRELGPFVQSNFTFKRVTLQQEYNIYWCFAKVPGTEDIMITASLKAKLGSVYFLLTWNKLTSEYQHFKFNNKFHLRLPIGCNVIFSSASKIYCLSPTALFTFDHVEKTNFKQIYSNVNHHYFNIGDVHEFGNVTDFYLISKLWKSIDILQMNVDCVNQIRRINLALLSPSLESVTKPLISRYFVDGYYLLWDRVSTALYLWNVKANSCAKVVDFRSKKPVRVRIFDRQVFLVTITGDQYCMEQIDLADFTD